MSARAGRRLRTLSAVLRDGAMSARFASIVDSRSYVRSLFLASAVRLDVLAHLVEPAMAADLATHLGVSRTDRLEAWLDVGVAVGELSRDAAARYQVRGRRARALARRQPLLVAHYRSMLDYQAAPYSEAADLFRGEPGTGRDDLQRHADVIAGVSRAAAPFVVPYLEEVVRSRRPRTILDVGCGLGAALEAMLLVAPDAIGYGIDVAPDVVAATRARLEETEVCCRVEISVGDARRALADDTARYDLVTLLNNIYYFAPEARPALYRHVHRALAPRGEIVVVTMEAGSSVASAHLDLMLRSQAAPAALPRAGEVARWLAEAGFAAVETERLVPGEPFVAVRGTVPASRGQSTAGCSSASSRSLFLRILSRVPVGNSSTK